jgi:hypothetical protein
MLVARGRGLVADPQKHDLEPVGIAHCDAVHFRVAMPPVRHLLPGQKFLGAVQFGGVPRTPEDARYPGFAHIMPGGLPISRITSELAGARWPCSTRQRAVVPHDLQRQHVTVERQRAVKVTNRR